VFLQALKKQLSKKQLLSVRGFASGSQNQKKKSLFEGHILFFF